MTTNKLSPEETRNLKEIDSLSNIIPIICHVG